MEDNLLTQIDELTGEVENLTAVMEKTETFRAFNQWVAERYSRKDVLMEINRYKNYLSVNPEGLVKADTLLQIRYTDEEGEQG